MTVSEADGPGEASGQLREVLAAVEAGDLEAEPDQVAYLRGAADALTVLSGRVSKPSK